MRDEVDVVGDGVVGVLGRKCAQILQVEELSVTMVWREVVVGKEVGAQDSLLDISHGKLILERLVADLDCGDCGSITLNWRPIRCLEAGAVGTFESLSVGRGNDGDYGASVDHPFLVLTLVCNV